MKTYTLSSRGFTLPIISLFFMLVSSTMIAENMAIELNPNTATDNDWIEIPNHSSLNPTINFSILIWVQTYDNRTAKVIEKETWNSGWTIGQDKWNGWKGGFVNTSGTRFDVAWSDGVPTANQWYHLAMTYDGSYLRLYVDGEIVDSTAASGLVKTNTQPISIGADGGGNQKYFEGVVDETQFWQDALAKSEINAIKDNYISSSSIPSALDWNDLLAYYKMDEALNSTTVIDHSNNSNDGTLKNTLPQDVRIPSTAFSGDDSGLPISLLYFESEFDGHQWYLLWSTGSEVNNDYFVVQQSFDGINFSDLDIVYGAGNSNSPISYSYVLPNLPNHTVYFRLKQVDFDGTTTLLPSLMVYPAHEQKLEIIGYELSNQQLFVNVDASAQQYTIELYDIEGRKVLEAEPNDELFGMPWNGAHGIYFVVVKTAQKATSMKIML
jgi:hypothetical protein